jgi:putative transposase
MRHNRHLVQNAVYDVTARINRGEMVFNEIAMRELFLAFIKQVKKKYPMAIYNFCIMGNHIHFAIRPDKDSSLSKIMQWLLGNYAKAWNKAHGVKGHLWGDRFFSKIIRGGGGLQEVFKYINLNPVKAGLVGRADEWEYGGVCHFIKGETSILDIPPWIEAAYQAFCNSRLDCLV